jgi:hypothetical protein
VAESPKIQKKNLKAELPAFGQKVIVQCEGYRGLAYQNSTGQWKTDDDNRNLPKYIEILLLTEDFSNQAWRN